MDRSLRTTFGAVLVAAAAASLAACAGNDREHPCTIVAASDREACFQDARDPRWEFEERRYERAANAKTDQEKQRAECEALTEIEASKCLARINPTMTP